MNIEKLSTTNKTDLLFNKFKTINFKVTHKANLRLSDGANSVVCACPMHVEQHLQPENSSQEWNKNRSLKQYYTEVQTKYISKNKIELHAMHKGGKKVLLQLNFEELMCKT